jgi:nucleoside-diphosphate-sugar epimerase
MVTPARRPAASGDASDLLRFALCRSQLAAEHLVESNHRAYGMRTVNLRLSNTYGPFQKSSGEGAWSASLSTHLRGEDLPIYGDGLQTRIC